MEETPKTRTKTAHPQNENPKLKPHPNKTEIRSEERQ